MTRFARSTGRTLVLCAAVWLGPGEGLARAQEGTGKVAAEALFEQARALVADGKIAEACPKFADSQRLDPSPGTLLNLASCYEKLGRSATAWATYREAASAANATGRTEYLATAQRHAEALAPHLARLTITVTQPVDGLRVVRDGVEVGRPEWGVPIPIDPGSHAIEASAPAFKGWASSVMVPADGGQLTVTVPVLEQAAAAATAPAAVVAPVSPPAPTPVTSAPAPAPEPRSSGGTQRVLGLVVAGAGVVGLGLSGAFAIVAKNQYNASLSSCQPSNPDLCSQGGVTQRNTALTDGNVATVTLIGGGALLIAGAIVWLTAPSGHATPASGQITVAPTLGGALLQGAF